MVELDRLDANRKQPRKNFDEQGLAELAQSITETGILQPILVTRNGDRFQILAGERRFRAAALAGLQRVPVLVKEGLEDRDQLLIMLIENVQRRDLTPLEEAEAFRQLRDDFGMTQEGVAERVGKDRATVANTLRLLKLPLEIRTALEEGLLTAGHARALLALPSAADQEKVAREAIKEGLSVRLTEARVAALMKDSPAAKEKRERAADPDTRDAERRLERALSTKVEIRRRKKGGEVRITFFSEEQLIGLFERFVKEEG
jgi:ParB family chromosome partitioning protein